MPDEGCRMVFPGTQLLGLSVEGEGREPGAVPWPHLGLGRQGLSGKAFRGKGEHKCPGSLTVKRPRTIGTKAQS